MNHNDIFSLSFPEAKTIIVSGDIHGDFNQLVFKLCIQYQLTNTLLIVAGDCGFGFEKKEYYEQMVRRNVKRMNQANNWIVFVRGNHDNLAYFDGSMFNFKRFIAVPDYAILQACNHTILCVGGAISIDRIYRINDGTNGNIVFTPMSRKKMIFLAIYIGRMKFLFTTQIRWMPSVLVS